MIRAGLRTDSVIGVTKFGIRKLKTFMLYDFWPTIQFLSTAIVELLEIGRTEPLPPAPVGMRSRASGVARSRT